MASIENAAQTAIKMCLRVKHGESVLVLTDEYAEKVGCALEQAALAVTPRVLFVKMPMLLDDGAEPWSVAANLLPQFDVVVCPMKHSLTHSAARKKACERGTRIATLPGITPDMFCRAMDVDFEKLRSDALSLEKVLARAKKARITTRSGTNFSLALGHPIVPDFGSISRPGDYGNLPAGEVFTAPLEGKSEGIIVIDHMGELCKPKTKIMVRKGRVIEVFGDDAFAAKMRGKKNAENIGEFGIGINPKAVLSGIMLEDEKVAGTCHVAFGSSFGFGGRVKAEVHWDAVLLKPTIHLDYKKIMDDGELLI